MQSAHSAYFLALISAVLFSGASVVFAQFSKSHSSLWMNLVKNAVALVAFTICSVFLWLAGDEQYSQLHFYSILYLLLSGMIGLAVGDYFLFLAYQRIGSARTLMVFSFSPLFLALGAFFAFGQGLALYQMIALAFMMACVWTISYEKFRAEGHWELKGIFFALLGVLLDNFGILLTRKAFDLSPSTNAFTANMFRCIGAVLLFSFLQKRAGLNVWKDLRGLSVRDRRMAVGASFFGTFLSLSFWLTALKIGHIGSLAGVGAFNPVAASTWEWAMNRKRPSMYLWAALALFLIGFFILLKGGG